MLLYHGTSTEYQDSILQKGLVPRGNGRGNWNQIPSHPGCVYLSTYGTYFAVRFPKWLILELDTEQLDELSLLPDEDTICLDVPSSVGPSGTKERIAWARGQMKKSIKNAEGKIIDWRHSLEYLGTCCHEGPIPLKAITKYAVYDPLVNPVITKEIETIQVSRHSYQQYGHQFRSLTRWIMGYEVPPEAIAFDRSELAELDTFDVENLYKKGEMELVAMGIRGPRFKVIHQAMKNRNGISVRLLP